MTGKNIYFVGICGTGMASLAAMLKNVGHTVSGSDQDVYPPMSTFLADQNIPIFAGFDAERLARVTPDLVVIGNAISRGNPEVEYVLNAKLPYASMPAALSEFFIRGRYSCVVTGTHGKTTTTALLAWILEASGRQPSFFVAGIPENFMQGFQLGAGDHFVSEGDEYDSAFFDKGPKFLHYRPDLVIINNVEFDHADIYNDLREIKTAFRRLINIIPGNGHIVANSDDPVVAELLGRTFSNVHRFGLSEQAPWRASEIRFEAGGTHFVISANGKAVAEVETSLVGYHNVQNVLAAFVAATQLGLAAGEITTAIGSFKGVRRRLSQIADIDGILIFEDFAHHATAVRETLRGVRLRFPERRILAVFEPRTASAKRKVFEHQYYSAFDQADEVLIAPLHRPEKVPEAERISIDNILVALTEKHIHARTVKHNDDLLSILPQELKRGDVVLFMSNGDFGGLPARLARALTPDKQERGK